MVFHYNYHTWQYVDSYGNLMLSLSCLCFLMNTAPDCIPYPFQDFMVCYFIAEYCIQGFSWFCYSRKLTLPVIKAAVLSSDTHSLRLILTICCSGSQQQPEAVPLCLNYFLRPVRKVHTRSRYFHQPDVSCIFLYLLQLFLQLDATGLLHSVRFLRCLNREICIYKWFCCMTVYTITI